VGRGPTGPGSGVAMAELLELHMAQSDLFAWNMEDDPLLRSTIVAVATLDRSPDWDRLVDMMERGTRVVPSFRQKVVMPPLRMSPPRWVIDPDFDLSWHLRRMTAPAPGDLDAVLEFARTTGMQSFDRARPLWEFTLLDGLEGGGAAFVMKIHHSLTDGIGGMQIAAEIVDFVREGTDRGPMPDCPEPESMGVLGSVGDALAYNCALGMEVVRHGAAAAVPSFRRAVSDPLGVAWRTARTAASAVKFVRPISTTLSPVMTERHLGWRYAVLDLPLEPLKDAGHSGGCTLNDAFLAGVLIGLRNYHEHHGAAVTELRVTMPVSLRTEDDAAGGNKVTLVRFPLPLDVFDPHKLMQAVDDRVAAWRREPAVPLSGMIAGVLNLLPSPVIGGMLKHVDFLASNVPGSPVPMYVAGAKVGRYYAFGPTIGAAVNVTLMSYDDVCCVGINVDTGAVPDLDQLRDSLARGFEEVLAVGGGHHRVVRPGA
jgi:diacylglycerol O-acyltransferase / wax synthase